MKVVTHLLSIINGPLVSIAWSPLELDVILEVDSRCLPYLDWRIQCNYL